jgi:hypothetical protein
MEYGNFGNHIMPSLSTSLPLISVHFLVLYQDIYRSSNLTIKNIVRRPMKLPWILDAPARRQLNISYLKRK